MKKILIIEDELDLAMTVASRLKEAGYQVNVANDGVEALDALKKETFDLIITDIMMQVLDGISFLAILRARDDTGKIPIIVLSARSDNETIDACKSLGVTDYLIKPYEYGRLIEKIRGVLREA